MVNPSPLPPYPHREALLPRDLWAAWYGRERTNAAVFDVSRRRDLVIAGTLASDALYGGVVFDGAASTSYAGLAAGHQMTSFTHVAVITVTSLAAWQCVSCIAEAPGSGSVDRGLFVGTSGQVGFYIYDGAAKTASSASSSVAVGGVYVVAGRSNGVTLDVYIDGLNAGSVAAGTAFTGFATPELVLGWGYDGNIVGGISSTLKVHSHFVFSRALSDGEILGFSRDPYAALRQPTRRIFRTPPYTSGFSGWWASQRSGGLGIGAR